MIEQSVFTDAPDLMEWFMPWLEGNKDSDLYYYEAAKNQIIFVRDQIAGLILPRMRYEDRPEVEVIDYDPHSRNKTRTVKRTCRVLSTHRSKSCVLPVYGFERPDLGLQIIMRGNFHDWKLTVISERPIYLTQFQKLFYTEPPPEPEYTGNHLSPVYFEGFREEWVRGYYGTNEGEWSCMIGDKQSLWTTIFLIMDYLGELPIRQYTTKAKHRAELNLEP